MWLPCLLVGLPAYFTHEHAFGPWATCSLCGLHTKHVALYSPLCSAVCLTCNRYATEHALDSTDFAGQYCVIRASTHARNREIWFQTFFVKIFFRSRAFTYLHTQSMPCEHHCAFLFVRRCTCFSSTHLFVVPNYFLLATIGPWVLHRCNGVLHSDSVGMTCPRNGMVHSASASVGMTMQWGVQMHCGHGGLGQ